jgi:hypothetical protein
MQPQKQDKCLSLYLNLTFVSLVCSLAKSKTIRNLLKMHFVVPYDALTGSFVEQCVQRWQCISIIHVLAGKNPLGTGLGTSTDNI